MRTSPKSLRAVSLGAWLFVSFVAPAAFAEEPEPAAPVEDLPTPPEWRLKYEEARNKLATGDFAEAAVKFAELEKTATNRTDRAVAHVQRTLADDWTSRNLTFVHRLDLTDPNLTARAVDKRSTDELVSLYTTSVFYGVGSGLWLATLTKPDAAAAAILPTIALTAGSVGTVIALDSGRGFRYGIPQSIVTGTFIGLEHGIVWTIWANERRGHPDLPSEAQSTLIWSFATVGAVTGGVLGEVMGTTPGRSAWVGSTAFWSAAIVGFTTGALVQNDPASPAAAAMGVSLSAGTGIGMLTAGGVSPSVSRVRLLDLSGFLGGLTTAAIYIAAANDKSEARAASGIAALGIAAGLGVGWVATSSIEQDHPRQRRPAEESSSMSRMIGKLRPAFMPTAAGGVMIGAGGTLD